MKSVIISIRPKWCEKIASGGKTIEVRKTRPKIDVPFKCYIYCTQNNDVNDLLEYHFNGKIIKMNGKVIGEFVCDEISEYANKQGEEVGEMMYYISTVDGEKTCLSYGEFKKYGKGKPLYGWHISAMKIYDKPKEVKEFMLYEPKYKLIEKNQHISRYREVTHLTRPPQSWQYVEEVTDV